jgi:hypothetical protein
VPRLNDCRVNRGEDGNQCPARERSSSLHVSGRSARNKSLFASFSSEKEEVFFFEKKNQKTFISGALLPEQVLSGGNLTRWCRKSGITKGEVSSGHCPMSAVSRMLLTMAVILVAQSALAQNSEADGGRWMINIYGTGIFFPESQRQGFAR